MTRLTDGHGNATLCDACAKHFAWCKSNPTFSQTSDAVVGCDSFEAVQEFLGPLDASKG